MEKDEIIELARQVGIRGPVIDFHKKELEVFAKLVAEKEREACAKVCETRWKDSPWLIEAADAIRARGQA